MSDVKINYEVLIPNSLRIFLDEKGLTQSAANHQANMIKELMKVTKNNLKKTNGFTSEVSINSEKVSLDNFVKLPDLKEQSLKEGYYYGLSAWLREAIEAKHQASSLAEICALNSYIEEGEAIAPFTKLPPVMKHVLVKSFTEQDALNELTIRERQEYLSVEAQAAHLGKKLHKAPRRSDAWRADVPDNDGEGKLAEIREQLQTFRASELREYSLGGASKQVCVVTNTALYTEEEINQLYTELQEQHRTYEARLNYYKAKIKDRISAENIRLREEYTRELSDAQTAYQIEVRAFQADQAEYQKSVTLQNQTFEKRRLELVKYISKLKIIIPDALKELSEEISKLSKSENDETK